VAIKALQDAGRYAQALEQVTAVVADPRTSEYDPVMAEALNRMALLLVDTGRNRDAHAPIEEALWLAEGSRHDVLVIELATVEIYLSGYLEHDMVRAQHWANQARVFLKRVGGHDLLRAWMLNNIGVALDANGDKVAAAEELEESLRIKERILGKDHPDVAFSLANLADTLNSIGRSKEALELSNRGVEILSRTFGASHPRLIAQLANRAEILNRLGRYEEARHDAERAVAVQRTEAGPELNLIYALAPLGEAELGLGHSTRAIAPLRQALHLAEEQAVTEELPRLRFALARSLWDSGRDRKQARLLAAAAAAPVASWPTSCGGRRRPRRRPLRARRPQRRHRRRRFRCRRRRGCPSTVHRRRQPPSRSCRDLTSGPVRGPGPVRSPRRRRSRSRSRSPGRKPRAGLRLRLRLRQD
jgi:serine/threonine-protein kinase